MYQKVTLCGTPSLPVFSVTAKGADQIYLRVTVETGTEEKPVPNHYHVTMYGEQAKTMAQIVGEHIKTHKAIEAMIKATVTDEAAQTKMLSLYGGLPKVVVTGELASATAKITPEGFCASVIAVWGRQLTLSTALQPDYAVIDTYGNPGRTPVLKYDEKDETIARTFFSLAWQKYTKKDNKKNEAAAKANAKPNADEDDDDDTIWFSCFSRNDLAMRVSRLYLRSMSLSVRSTRRGTPVDTNADTIERSPAASEAITPGSDGMRSLS